MKHLAIALGLAIAVPLSTPVFADGHAVKTKVLTISKGLCAGTGESLRGWANATKTIGAYAVPSLLPRSDVSCDNPGEPITAGQSFGAATVAQASALALEACESFRTESYGPCVVIATLTLR